MAKNITNQKHAVDSAGFANEYARNEIVDDESVIQPFYRGRASVAMEYIRNEVRKEMAPFYQILGHAKDAPSLFYRGRASVAMEYIRNEVRKEMAPFYQILGHAKDAPSLSTSFAELLAQHESDIIDLDLLETAILQNDRQYQLLLRIEDMKRRKKAVIAKATGDDQQSNQQSN